MAPQHEDGSVVTSDMTPQQAQRALNETIGKHAKVLSDLEKQGRESSEKLETVNKMLGETREAIGKLRESQMDVANRALTGDEAELTRYVKRDGSVRLLGEASSEELYQPGLLDTPVVHGRWHQQLRTLIGMRSIARLTCRGGKTPKIDRAISQHVKSAPNAVKRIFGEASQGADWIPTENLVPDLDRDLRIMAEGSLAGIFETTSVSTEVVTIPFATSGGTPYIQGEPVSDPAQYTATMVGTAQRTHTPKTFAMRYQADNNSAEDSVVDTFPMLRMQMAADLTDGYEDAMINGDTAATHQDTGLSAWNPISRWSASTFGGAADHRKAFIGFRARAADISNTLDMGSLQTFDGVTQLRSQLASRYGRDSILIVNEQFLYLKMMAFDELQKTDSAVGQVQDGRIMTVAGMPVFMSAFLTSDLNASGVYDDSTKTKAGLIVANRSRFRHYERRGVLVELSRDITRGVTDIVGTFRRTFKTNDGSTVKNVAYGYNLL